MNQRCSELFSKPSKFGNSQCKELDPNPGARQYANNYWEQFPHPDAGQPGAVPACSSKDKSLLKLIYNLDSTLAARQAALNLLEEEQAGADGGGRALLEVQLMRSKPPACLHTSTTDWAVSLSQFSHTFCVRASLEKSAATLTGGEWCRFTQATRGRGPSGKTGRVAEFVKTIKTKDPVKRRESLEKALAFLTDMKRQVGHTRPHTRQLRHTIRHAC